MDLSKNKITATLVYPVRDGKVLLAKKTRKIGVGLWNGWGGEVEEGETISGCATRELYEESGLSCEEKNLEYCGVVTFHNKRSDGSDFDVVVHLFVARDWQGDLSPKDEMSEPSFWPIDNLPLDQMMISDREWINHVFEGRRIEAEVWYGPEQKSLVRPTEIKLVAPASSLQSKRGIAEATPGQLC